MHFTREEWMKFRLGELCQVERETMMKHLAVCGWCLEAYLQTIGQRDRELAETAMDPDFTPRVVQRIQARNERSRLLHYAMAAAVAVALTAAGWFDALPLAIPHAIEETISAFERAEIRLPGDWVHELTGCLSALVSPLTR